MSILRPPSFISPLVSVRQCEIMALPSPIVDDFPEFTMMRPLPSVPEMGVPELGQERERLEIYHLRVRPRDDDEPRARQQAHAAEDQPYKSTFDHEDSSHVQLRLPQFTLQGRVKVSEEDVSRTNETPRTSICELTMSRVRTL